jgi:hypothetical protein
MLYRVVGPMIDTSIKDNQVCTLTSFSKEPSAISLPIGQNILSFTFFYLLYSILKNHIESSNVITLVFYPALIVFDFAWNVTNDCYNAGQLLFSFVMGAGLGTLFSYLIDTSGFTSFQYFYLGAPTSEVCSRPSTQTFKCNVYKNGALIGSTNTSSQ